MSIDNTRIWLVSHFLIALSTLGLFLASLAAVQTVGKLMYWDAAMSLAALNILLLGRTLNQQRNSGAQIAPVFLIGMVLPMAAVLHALGGHIISSGSRHSHTVNWLSGREVFDLPIGLMLMGTVCMVVVMCAGCFFLQRSAVVTPDTPSQLEQRTGQQRATHGASDQAERAA